MQTDRSEVAFLVPEPTAKLGQALALTPNPSLKLTRYGRHCKPGPRHMVHHREPGLQRLPPRAA